VVRPARPLLAECAGTALLVGIGTGTIVAAAGHGGIPQWLMAVAWFAAVLVPIVLFVRVSGAHLNPVVTVALRLSGRTPTVPVLEYVAAQLVGAFLGSAIVLATLGDAAHLGSTVPTAGNVARAFGAEAVFTAALVAAVFALSDRGEGRYRWRLALPPAAVGVSTFIIGPWSGSSLNPARTIAPAVLSGTYLDLWAYLTAVPLAAVVMAIVWRSANPSAG